MNDIVERLGVLAASLANPQVVVDAQQEIERLRAELASCEKNLVHALAEKGFIRDELAAAKVAPLR